MLHHHRVGAGKTVELRRIRGGIGARIRDVDVVAFR